MQRRIGMGLLWLGSLALLWLLVASARALQEQLVYEAVWARAEASPTPTPTLSPTPTVTPMPASTEFRGMWVTRFDWTSGTQPADPAKINEIVSDAAFAHINVIFFQVRANADAYYTPGLEPWAKRVSGTFGQPPKAAQPVLGPAVRPDPDRPRPGYPGSRLLERLSRLG